MMSMRNPSSTAPTSAFIIRTQAGYANSKGVITYYDIDVNISGIFYQINTTTTFE
jgi:hypothetical protein